MAQQMSHQQMPPCERATSAAHLPPRTAKNCTCLTNQFSSLVSKSIQLSPIEVLSMKILCTKKDFYCAILKPKFVYRGACLALFTCQFCNI